MSIYAVTNGFLDDIDVARVRQFEREFLDFMRARRPEVGEAIRSSRDLNNATAEQLAGAIKEFKQIFGAGAGA